LKSEFEVVNTRHLFHGRKKQIKVKKLCKSYPPLTLPSQEKVVAGILCGP
jgi:hypothetical protein